MTSLPKRPKRSQEERKAESSVEATDSLANSTEPLNQSAQESKYPSPTFSAKSSSQIGSSVSQTESLQTNEQSSIDHDNPVKKRQSAIGTLASLNHYSPIDCFVQLITRERRLTKDGNPFYKVIFRDARQSAHSILWNDNPLFKECEKNWKNGNYYKIRGLVRNSNYGTQLEILRIREVTPDDESDGFNENKCRPSSEIPPESIAAEILVLANQHLNKTSLLRLVQKIFKDKRLALHESPASRSHHRTYVGGLLEHTLSVTKLSILLTDFFHSTIPQTKSQLYKPLVVAGAILHDIGKIIDTEMLVTGPKHTLAGELVGHAILGAEIVQRYADEVGVNGCLKTQLIHLILTHSRFPEWGAPTPPSTLEAMVLHYADYVDSTFVSSLKLLSEDFGNDSFTERKGPFGIPILKPMYSLLVENNSLKAQQSETQEDKNAPQ